MSVLDLRDVSKTYGQGSAQVRALARVSLSVAAGEMVAVMGPSGSGKSTLLTIAGSLEEPAGGEVRVCGKALAELAALEALGMSERVSRDGRVTGQTSPPSGPESLLPDPEHSR